MFANANRKIQKFSRKAECAILKLQNGFNLCVITLQPIRATSKVSTLGIPSPTFHPLRVGRCICFPPVATGGYYNLKSL